MNDQHQQPLTLIVVLLEQNADTVCQDFIHVLITFTCMLLSVSAIFWPYSISLKSISPILMSFGFYIATELVFLNNNQTLGELTPFIMMFFYYIYCLACRCLIAFLTSPSPSHSDSQSDSEESLSGSEEDEQEENAEGVEVEDNPEHEYEQGYDPQSDEESESEELEIAEPADNQGVFVDVTYVAGQILTEEQWEFGREWVNTPLGRFDCNPQVISSFILNVDSAVYRIDKSDVHPGQGILFIQQNDQWIVSATWRIRPPTTTEASSPSLDSDEHTFSLLTASVIN